MSYPLVNPPQFERISTRPWLDVDPPPPSLLSNPPHPPHPPQSTDLYWASTHIVPASYLRHNALLSPPPPPMGDTKAERAESVKNIFAELTHARTSYWKGKYGHSRQAILWNCINRYVPKQKRKPGPGITLFFAHANGFPKEIWETTLLYLLALETPIDDIWVWESVQHGDSALLNRGQESAIFEWADNSNDILSFLLHYFPTSSEQKALPVHLPRVFESETKIRKEAGFKERTLVTIGHSYGGCTSTMSALRCPILFDSIILVDPVLTQHHKLLGQYDITTHTGLVVGAVQRRSEWPSKEDALKAFSNNPFFAAWDPSVLQTYIDRGLYVDTENNNVRLKMSGIQEAICFLDTLTAREIYQLVENLDEKIELLWVMPGKDDVHPIGGQGAAQYVVWRRPMNSANICIHGAGHLIPLEAPREFAQTVAIFLQRKYGTAKPSQSRL